MSVKQEAPEAVLELAEGDEVVFKGVHKGMDVYYVVQKPGSIVGLPLYILYNQKKDKAEFGDSAELMSFL